MKTQVREFPIFLSTPMVQAILEGKTQTRRIAELSGSPDFRRCPYGKVGDRLWVRETWRPRSWGSNFDWMIIEFAAGGKLEINPFEVWDAPLEAETRWESLEKECIRAGCHRTESGNFVLCKPDGSFPIKWRSPVLMPRSISRILLEITSLRVERLQEISEEDAIAEGARYFADLPSIHPWGQDPRWSMEAPASTEDCLDSARFAFGNFWNKLAKNTSAWDLNPWVWVITFRVIDSMMEVIAL
jgi:hypothetical protein